MAVSAPAYAQSITAEVRGSVEGPSGPVAGATVAIIDTRTNRKVTTSTGANGLFSVSNLEIGGPYTIEASAEGFQSKRAEDVTLNLTGSTNLRFDLVALEGTNEEIVVVAARSVVSDLAIGPNSTFNLERLQSLPSIDRDLRDILRLDPRIVLDTNPEGETGVACLGQNNRQNAFTIDGVRNADPFGLNASGFVNRFGPPLPFDAQREISIEFAPQSVEFSGFSGCNINVVTKSGTNEFHGSGFAVFNSASLTGRTIEGGEVISPNNFRNYNWGATFGGPIIKDKLFFFAAYEEVNDSGGIVEEGPAELGFSQGQQFVTVDQIDQIADIIRNTFGFEPGGITFTTPAENRRILTRWDWNITDRHRAAFTYNRFREAVVDEDGNSAGTFGFSNNFEIQGTESELYSLRLFSNWTDNFSTEIRISRNDVTDLQDPVGGGEAQDANPIPRILVLVQNDFNNNGSIAAGPEQGLVLAGPGFFRSSNFLQTQVDQLKFKGDYTLGRHKFTAGYELDALDVFNLFIPNATGTFAFSSIANLAAGITTPGGPLTNGNFTTNQGETEIAAGTAPGVTGNGSATGNPNDAAAAFSRSIHSLYAQDEWRPTDFLTITLGLRYDFFTGDRVPLNEAFVDRFGFDNTQAFNGLDVFLPRLGVTYEVPESLFGSTTFRAGAGIFSGGDPTVWFSNAFSNNGGNNAPGNSGLGPIVAGAPCTAADLDVVNASGQFLGIPNCVLNQQQATASLGLGNVQAVDPNIELPTVIRANFGLSHRTDFGGVAAGFFDDWNIQLDVIHSRFRNGFDFVDLALAPIGTTPSGGVVFDNIDPSAPGCTAELLGIREGFANVNTACFATGREDEIILTNAVDNGGNTTFFTQFQKQFDTRFFGQSGDIDFSLAYTFNNSRDNASNTNSTATSGVNSTPVNVLNVRPVTLSPFNNAHNVTLATSFRHEFIRGLSSRFTSVFQARSGRPFSFVFDDSNFAPSVSADFQLAVVPDLSNPVTTVAGCAAVNCDVIITPAALTELQNFIANTDDTLAGFSGLTSRNQFRADWFFDLDLRFQQDLPSFKGIRPQFFVDIQNVLNLIGDENNLFRSRSAAEDLFELTTASTLGGVPLSNGFANVNGQLVPVIGDIEETQGEPVVQAIPSLWAVQFGLRFDF